MVSVLVSVFGVSLADWLFAGWLDMKLLGVLVVFLVVNVSFLVGEYFFVGWFACWLVSWFTS